MNDAPAVAVVICAAGKSSRMGAEMGGVKKEYQKLNNSEDSLTVLGSAVSAFAAAAFVETIVIAVPANGEVEAGAALPPGILAASKPKIMFIEGGDSRRASVFKALSFLKTLHADSAYSPRYVLIHDGARPWVSSGLIERIIAAVKEHNAVIPLLPLTDTPKEVDSAQWSVISEQGADSTEQRAKIPAAFIKRHLKRTDTGIAQTPQAFKFPEILQAHEKAALENEDFTDDAEVWGRFCGPVAVIPGDPANRKITFPEDLGNEELGVRN